jgi:hypothetical protein
MIGGRLGKGSGSRDAGREGEHDERAFQGIHLCFGFFERDVRFRTRRAPVSKVS